MQTKDQNEMMKTEDDNGINICTYNVCTQKVDKVPV